MVLINKLGANSAFAEVTFTLLSGGSVRAIFENRS